MCIHLCIVRLESRKAIVADTSIYCFALMLPHTYEQGLLAMQFKASMYIYIYIYIRICICICVYIYIYT